MQSLANTRDSGTFPNSYKINSDLIICLVAICHCILQINTMQRFAFLSAHGRTVKSTERLAQKRLWLNFIVLEHDLSDCI